MKEIPFQIEETEDDGYIASAIDQSIVTEADTLEELKANIREATRCHFDENQTPKITYYLFRNRVAASCLCDDLSL